MTQSKAGWLTLGLVIGLIVGVSLSGVLPQTPVHAMATHGQDSFAIATGLVQDDIEAIYFLDFLTGDLRAAVLSFQTGKFLSFFTYNVSSDLSQPGAKNPRYLLVTGIADFKRGFTGNIQPGRSVIYVAEATSGQVAAYALPWSSQLQIAGRPQTGNLVPLDKKKFRNVAIREEE
jgi:hypothetical protein